MTGQGGGHQAHLRLTGRSGHYILFEGANGSLAEQPGSTYAGAFLPGTGEAGANDAGSGMLTACQPTPRNRRLLEAVAEFRRKSGLPPLAEEEPGGPFAAWF